MDKTQKSLHALQRVTKMLESEYAQGNLSAEQLVAQLESVALYARKIAMDEAPGLARRQRRSGFASPALR